ncbi:peptidoglycan-binding protein [Leisingera sp. XS_AS12]|uniref:peptidoglycan-binding domain-containing protein n=1 Tax=Leisingera sp. XS_AS12 TaxID=3241294 RepID=UPI0035192DD7
MLGKSEFRIRSSCTAFLAAFLVGIAPAIEAQVNGNQGVAGRPKERPNYLILPTPSPGSAASVYSGRPCVSVPDNPCIHRRTIRDLQQGLNVLGFDAGPADGIFGSRTSRALNAYRAAKGFPSTGYPLSKEAEAIIAAAREAEGRQQIVAIATAALAPPSAPLEAPVPTRVFAGPGQFPPSRFRGYGFLAFPALASEYDYDRHMKLCQAYVNSLPATSSVREQREDQFVTVWPVKDKKLASSLNGTFLRLETSTKCARAIDDYDDGQAREVLTDVRAAQDITLDGRGPYLFGWIPADEYGQKGKLILMLDLSRVTTYEQALVQLQSWQQKIATNPELLRDGLSIENVRRMIRDWSDQHGQAFLMLIGAG